MIHPYDYNLVKPLLANIGEECPKYTSRPSLVNAPGYNAMVGARRTRLDAEMSVANEMRKPARKLSAQRSSPKKPRHKKSRTQQDIKEQEEGSPIPVDVELPAVECNGSSFPTMTVQMLKCVKSNEHMWANANDVCKILPSIFEHGVTVDMVSTKKACKMGADDVAETDDDNGGDAAESVHAASEIEA